MIKAFSLLKYWHLFASALFLSPFLCAQTEQPAFGASLHNAAGQTSLGAPREVYASDGIYDKFVLIRWEAAESATQYKVFRSNSPNSGTVQALNNTWQKSTWLCDYSALPGVDYYYSVVASNGREVSPSSTSDKGYIKKNNGTANDDRDELSSNEAYGNQQQVFLLIAELSPSKQEYAPGDSMKLSVRFQNIFDKPAARTEIRYFLSKDAIWDWNDELLHRKTLSSIQANTTFTLSEQLILPTVLLPGAYHIIAVCSADGAILSSKTDLTTFKIVD